MESSEFRGVAEATDVVRLSAVVDGLANAGYAIDDRNLLQWRNAGLVASPYKLALQNAGSFSISRSSARRLHHMLEVERALPGQPTVPNLCFHLAFFGDDAVPAPLVAQ